MAVNRTNNVFLNKVHPMSSASTPFPSTAQLMDDDESSQNMSGQTQASYSRSRRSLDGGSVDTAALQRLKIKQDVCDKILKRLREAGAEGIDEPGFADELEEHFKKLPTRFLLLILCFNHYNGFFVYMTI